MKIAFLVSGFPPHYIGGAELQTYNLSRRLADGNDVTVFTGLAKGAKKEERMDGILVKRIWTPPIPVLRYFWFIASATRALRKGGKGSFDVIHCVYTSPAGVAGVMARKAVGAPVIASVRSTKNYAGGWLQRRINSFVFRRADRVFIQTQSQKKDMLGTYPWVPQGKVRVIPNGIEPAKAKVKARHGRHVLYLGRLTGMKGVEGLIEAMRLIPEKERPPLVIAGYGPLSGKLQDLSAGMDVKFTGKVDPSDVRAAMAGAMVYVLPSVYGEGFPTTILEAMSVGVPVIATRLVGIEGDIIKDGKTGLLVEPGSPRELSKAIVKIMGDPALRKRLSSAGLSCVRNFGWKRVTGMVLREYESVVMEKP